MAKYRWPTDPPGKKASHSIPWATHQRNVANQRPGYQGQQYGGFRTGSGYGAAGPGGGAPASQGPAAPPFDPALEAARSRGTQRRTNLLSDEEVDLQQTSSQFGFSYNPATGAFGGFDPSNPFSQAALLMKSRKERDTGENTSYASRGQLYSGAYGAAKQETQHQYDKGYDTLRRGYEDYVKRYLRRKRDIQATPIEELASL